jgi:Bacterial PH domain/GYF domain 2
MEIFIHKNEQQHGPYDEEQILAMLNEGQVGRRDLIFYEGMEGWQPLEEIFDVEEQLSHQMDEGQEPDVVAEVYQTMSHIMARDERIFYLAHQKKRMMKSRPDVVVVTNERLIIIRQGLGGSRTEDYLWRNVISVQMKEGIMGNTFSILDINDHIVQVDDLPKTQLEKLCQFSQEMRAELVK